MCGRYANHSCLLLACFALAFSASERVSAAGFTLTPDTSPRQVIAAIDRDGPRQVIDDIWSKDSGETFEKLIDDRVEAGDPEWLEVARRLRPKADAAVAEGLDYSVARALPISPEAVLGLAGRGFELADICTSPVNEPNPGVAERYRQAAVSALGRVKAKNLLEVRDRCLEWVGEPRRDLRVRPLRPLRSDPSVQKK
jgi:hypothetical protein